MQNNQVPFTKAGVILFAVHFNNLPVEFFDAHTRNGPSPGHPDGKRLGPLGLNRAVLGFSLGLDVVFQALD
jgi:hypothetical protein